MSNEYEFFLDNIQDPDECLNFLKPYQKKRIEALFAQGYDYEKTAEIWMGTALKDNSPFSTQPDQNRYYEQLVQKIRKFLCDNSEYDENRKQLVEVPKYLLEEHFISVISGVLDAKLGLAVALIAPVIDLCVIAACKISVNAWCNI